MRLGLLSFLMASGALVGACASGPELNIDLAPVEAMRFESIAVLNAEDAQQAQVVAVLSALARDWGVKPGSQWHLEAALAVRPVSVGTAKEADAREGRWDVAPRALGARRGPALHVLSVVAHSGDGEDLRRVTVSCRGPAGETPQALLDLLAKEAARLLIEGREGF